VLSPWQKKPAAQVPQVSAARALPQLSKPLFAPHTAPSRAQKALSGSGVHPHWFAAPPPPQLCPLPLHAPQSLTVRDAPQLSVVFTLPH
jgi:hypothetical protein